MANVHKDFHGALSYGIRFLTERYGDDKRRQFLSGLGTTVYAPLVDDMRQRGLTAMQEHLETIFSLEGGEFETTMEKDTLVFTVHRCPAIHHMKEHNYDIAPSFCDATRLVNTSICNAAGYVCSVDYDQEAGCCVQRFWRDAS
jgi:hypothetical protein